MQTYTPSALLKGVKALFITTMVGLEKYSLIPRIAEVVPSASDSEKYAWISPPQQMEQWDGELKFKTPTDTNYTITNTLFAAGVCISRSDLADDQVQGLRNHTIRLAVVARGHPNKLLMDALADGTSTADYYGASSYFFSDHTDRADEGHSGGSITNIVTGTGTTVAQITADMGSAITKLLRIKAENGEPFAEFVTKLAVVAPPDIQFNMETALTAGVVSQTENVQFNQFSFDRIYSARLSDTIDWYLLNATPGFRGLIFQDREPLEFVQASTTGDRAILQEQYVWKVRARYNVGYQYWQSAAKVNNS